MISNESEYFTERRRMYRMMIIVELIYADWFVLSELELANIYPKVGRCVTQVVGMLIFIQLSARTWILVQRYKL